MATSVSQGIFEGLFNLYLVIALLVGALVIGWLLWNLWAYRARPGAPRPADAPVAGVLPAERGRALWSWLLAVGIAAIMFGLAFSTISAIDAIERPPKDREWQHHNVTGYQFGWKYNYTGVGGVPFQRISPAQDWTVPVDTVIVLNITSQDVWHNYAIPEFRIRVDAIPGEVTRLWFEAKQTGSFPNVCVQLCGNGHAFMKGDMRVLSKADYEAWLAKESDAAFTKLGNDLQRDATRGTLRNVTLSAGGLDAGGDSVAAGKPVVFNVTNPGASPVTATAGSASVTVPAGGWARLWALAPASGDLVLRTSEGQTATYKAVSP